MTKFIFLLFLSFLHTTNAASLKLEVNSIKYKNSYIPKDISDEDLVKSYSLISSGVSKDKKNNLLIEGKYKIIATFIDRDINGKSLWTSVTGKDQWLYSVLVSPKNNGNINTNIKTIFNSLNNTSFTDEELSQYTEQQKRNLFIHVDKHLGLISEKQIADLMKEGENSMFLFNKQKNSEKEMTKEETKEEKNTKSLEDKKNFLLTTALNHENIQYIQEENSSNGSCVMVYSKLPKLDDAKLLGSAILGDANYRLIAVRNYLGECGMYLTDTVKIPFFIERSNNDKLMRFRISSIYPCDPQVFIKGKDERPDSWTINFSSMARMALINPDTSGIILDFLVNYNNNYKRIGNGPLIDQYLQDIPFEKSCSLDDLPVNVAKNALWDVRNFIDNYKDILSSSNNMTTILEKIKNYEKCCKKLQKTCISQSELLSNIYKLKQKLEADNLSFNKIFYISNMVSLFTQIQKIVDKMPDNEVKGWCTQIEKSFETINVNIYTLKNNAEEALKTILELNDQISKLLSDLNKDEKQKVKTEDSINHIKTSALTNSLNNTAAENPPPPLVPDKKAKKQGGKNDIFASYIEQNKKELKELIQKYNKEYQTLKTNVSDMKTVVNNSFIFFMTDREIEQVNEWKKNIAKYDKQLLSLKEMYKKLEDNFNVNKEIAQQNNSITQHDTQSSSLAATIKNDPTTIGESLIKLRQVVLKISSELKNEMPEEKK